MNKTTAPAAAPEKSLVERVSALAGSEERAFEPCGATVPAKAPEEHPAPDGYRRLSPVQILYRAEDYYRKLAKKCVGVAVVLALAAAVLMFIFRK